MITCHFCCHEFVPGSSTIVRIVKDHELLYHTDCFVAWKELDLEIADVLGQVQSVQWFERPFNI
jgi:hypothetical protein